LAIGKQSNYSGQQKGHLAQSRKARKERQKHWNR